ncbi:TetR/AcrR family transcriptional regulator [Actinomadura sp. 9N215]|uniref:TetR/AcrR family transcriptional regulator n=1 Tax=Actinomadura sp. 9N215 TaxID=3375150 RepID=UPI0037BB7D89
MREWIPVSTSPRGRLALAAVEAFGTRPFAEVTVTELASAANVTTGALYHHFGSKLGLYAFVRDDVERRLLDRMEGALAASGSASDRSAAASGSAPDRSAAVTSALLVGLDFAVREGFLHILGDPPAGTDHDRLAEMLSQSVSPPSVSPPSVSPASVSPASASPASVSPAASILGRVLAAAWRAALAAIAEGAEPDHARAAIAALRIHFPDGA